VDLSFFKLKIDIVQNIIKDYTLLANSGKIIILCWIPIHVNIHGNERADTAAKSALSLPITNMKLPACELMPCVSKFCLYEWQDIWDCCEGNKLHSIYPTFIPAISSIAKICPGTIPCYSTDFELVIMAALRSRCGHYIFALWFLSIFLSSFFYSSPNLSRRRLDVYRTSTHGVALL